MECGFEQIGEVPINEMFPLVFDDLDGKPKSTVLKEPKIDAHVKYIGKTEQKSRPKLFTAYYAQLYVLNILEISLSDWVLIY